MAEHWFATFRSSTLALNPSKANHLVKAIYDSSSIVVLVCSYEVGAKVFLHLSFAYSVLGE